MKMITKEKFNKYLAVQYEGRYNMLDERAIKATGLPENEYFEIITNYNKYKELYG